MIAARNSEKLNGYKFKNLFNHTLPCSSGNLDVMRFNDLPSINEYMNMWDYFRLNNKECKSCYGFIIKPNPIINKSQYKTIEKIFSKFIKKCFLNVHQINSIHFIQRSVKTNILYDIRLTCFNSTTTKEFSDDCFAWSCISSEINWVNIILNVSIETHQFLHFFIEEDKSKEHIYVLYEIHLESKYHKNYLRIVSDRLDKIKDKKDNNNLLECKLLNIYKYINEMLLSDS